MAIVCGSGLGGIARLVENPLVVPYSDVPQLPQTSVKGHSGRFVFGQCAARTAVVVMQGRWHQYEGHAPWQCTLGIRVLARLGVDTLLITNAAGGINADYRVGDIMLMRDHIDLPGMAGRSALVGGVDERFGMMRFVSMSNAYDVALRRKALQIAVEEGIGGVRQGVYSIICGPTFETPAEGRALRSLGADAGGMSTAVEVVVARQSGMKVLGVSLITNRIMQDDALEDEEAEVNHVEIVGVAEKRTDDLAKLLGKLIENLGK